MECSSRVDGSVINPQLESTTAQVPPSPQGGSTSPLRVITVSRDGVGFVVHWHRGRNEVKVAAGDAVAEARWVKAALLCANPRADTVQLTVLNLGLRTYIDGQRFLRVHFPLELRGTQRISFGGHPICYIAVPAPRLLSPSRNGECASPSLVTPANPVVLSGHGRPAPENQCGRQMLSVSNPKSSRFLSYPGSSQPPLCPREVGAHNLAKLTSTSPEALAAPVVPASMGSQLDCAACEATSTSPEALAAPVVPASMGSQLDCAACEATSTSPEALAAPVVPASMGSQLDCAACEAASTSLHLLGERVAEPLRCSSALPSNTIAVSTTSPVEDVSAVGQGEESGSISESFTGKLLTFPSQNCAVSVAHDSADVMHAAVTAAAAPLPLTSSEEEQAAGGAAGSLSEDFNGARSLSHPSLCDKQAEAELRESKVLHDSLHGEPDSRTRSQTRLCDSFGPLVRVHSPDWEALHGMQDDIIPPSKPPDIYQLSCGSVDLVEAVVALRRRRAEDLGASAMAAGRHPSPRRTHLQPPRPSALSASHKSSNWSSWGLNESTSVDQEDMRKGTDTHTTPRSGDGTSNALSSVLSSDPTTAENTRQQPYMREKLRLGPRIAVEPFVVEAFGNSHRYRPLANQIDPRHISSTRSSSTSGDESPPVDVFDAFGGVPWKYPAVADEMVTPRTEAFLRNILRRRPDLTSASEDAMFLHCALRRSYKTDTDTFTYMDSPAFVQNIYTRFSSLLAAVKARLEESRPVLHLSSPVLCGGDLFGCFASLMVLIDNVSYFSHWSTIHTQLLLLGNYVDVGWHSVEVCMLLCCWMYLQPSKVHLLRGPHEDPAVNGNYNHLGKRCLRYKCRQRFGSRKGLALWEQLNDIFALLPVAAVIDDRVFACHGGVPRLRSSPPLGHEESRDVAARRDCRSEAPGKRLYSCTSGLPTPTSLSFPSCTAANLFSPRQSAACASESTTGDDRDDLVHHHHHHHHGGGGGQGALFSPLRPLSMQHHRLATPVIEKLRDGETEEHAESREGSTPAELLPLVSRFDNKVNEDDELLCTGRNGPAETAVGVSSAVPSSCTTSPSEVTSLPRKGASDMAPEGRSDRSTAVTLPLAISSACVQSQLDIFSSSETSTQGQGDVLGTDRERFPPPLSTTSAHVSGSQERGAEGLDGAASPPSASGLVDEDELSDADLEALLVSLRTSEYSFPTLQPSTALENRDVARRLRLVRELLWNRSRSSSDKRLMPEKEHSTDEKDAIFLPWWRPQRVEGCCGGCPAGRAHRCCYTFGSGALIHFFLRFRFSLMIRGAPDDPSEVYGAELSEEGRLLTLSTCRRWCKMELQAAACLVESQTLRLFTWGSQELADSLGQVSLHSFPGLRETEAAREDFEDFVCETLQNRLREHNVVGLGNQWSVRSAYRAYVQQRAAVNAPSGGRGRGCG
ncbi:hypothetical protein JKF63_01568 [Porcisia hertigi]|uniref:Serine/threonine specific protein phosphatases domain-containing protein n=1 Tax=Porcisia hertigi TaxID=2761500 RepID=A0A836H3J2_9TRYP|nr:hypothetical protein JKF63_01568 [Porcisia hertigi]